jgi:L-lactate dehydrogenase complex protein LldG
MSSRDTILAAVWKNRPKGDHALPDLPDFPFDDRNPIAVFLKNLDAMGGQGLVGHSVAKVMQERFPNAKAIASAVPEYPGNRELGDIKHPRDLADLDVTIVRASFGIMETGSVLLIDQALICNAAAYLAQHLLVLLDRAEILSTLQAAYRRPELRQHRYASFHTGPSATADIEGVLIHGAQGVRSLTVIIDGRT